jgi:GT2 family glycosyltransferase
MILKGALKATVILCTRDRTEEMMRCLASLQQQTMQLHEIIVVDSSHVPLQQQEKFTGYFTQHMFPHVSLVYVHERSGLTYQRNRGLDKSTGDVIYFFDDDVILSKTYIENMHYIFENYAEYDGGMGTIEPLEPLRWNLSRILRILFFLQRTHASGKFTLSGMPTHAYGTRLLKRVEVLGGCCMAYRSSVCKNYLFDESFSMYGYMEDCDYSWRVSRSHALFFNPRAVLEHQRSSRNRDEIVKNRAMFIANYTYLFFKNIYPYHRLRLIVYLWSLLGLFIEALLCARSVMYIIGYTKGLMYAYRQKRLRPFCSERAVHDQSKAF